MPARPRPNRERGVLETVLVLDGRPVELDAHLARLEASLEALFPGRAPLPDLAAQVAAGAEALGRGGLRVTVAPGAEGELAAAIDPVAIEPRRVLPGEPMPVACRTLVLAGGLGGHKWADRRIVDSAAAQSGNELLPLILDWDGAVLEASRGNVFAVIGDTLLTPPADGRILPGISRARALEIAATAGLDTREREIRYDDLLVADEVFITGSLRGVETIGELDGTALSPPGEVGAHIAAELRRTWSHDGLDRVPRR